MAQNEFEFLSVKELGTIDGNIDVVYGHYKQGDKVYGDKVYLFESYTKKDGTEVRKSVGKFTLQQLNDLKELSIDNLDADASEDFD